MDKFLDCHPFHVLESSFMTFSRARCGFLVVVIDFVVVKCEVRNAEELMVCF